MLMQNVSRRKQPGQDPPLFLFPVMHRISLGQLDRLERHGQRAVVRSVAADEPGGVAKLAALLERHE